jgi:hypothetical protein
LYFRRPKDGSNGWYQAGSAVGVTVGVGVGMSVAVEGGTRLAVPVGEGVETGTGWQAEGRKEKRIASRGIIFRGGWIIRTRKPDLVLMDMFF